MTCKNCSHRLWHSYADVHYCEKTDKVVKEDDECMIQSIDPPKDVVNHPCHYETGKFECIEAMIETQGKESTQAFCICNAFKYIWRHRNKNQLEDVKKAIWYLNKFVELEENR